MLSVEGLQKSYRKRAVVNGVSLNIHQREIVGLLGPNGAGKTTVFYMIVGLERSDRGRFFSIQKRFPGCRCISGRGTDKLSAAGAVGLSQADGRREHTVGAPKPLDHEARARAPARTIIGRARHRIRAAHKRLPASGGERRRTEIARCLVIEPRFILLDEPFAGIDPIAVIDIQRILQKLRARGIGVLITDHNVRETLAITDRAYIINDGRIFRAGTPEELTRDEEVKRVYLGRILECNSF